MHFCFSVLLIEFGLLKCRLQNLETAHQIGINRHDGTTIIEFIAVVGSRKDGDKLTLSKELITIFHNLMSTADKIKVVFTEELLNNISTEGEGHTTVGLTPANKTLIRVRPEEIANQTSISNVTGADNLLDLIHDCEFGGEATVAAEDFLVDDAGDGEAVEGVGEGLPELDVVAALALVEEAIDTVDGGALVVTAEDEEVFGELDLEGEDEADAFETLLTTIDVVTEEEVVGGGREATIFEEAEEIVVLAVDVTADFDGGFKLEEGGLRHDDLAGLEGEIFDIIFGELDLLAGTGATDFEELFNNTVNVERHNSFFAFVFVLF